MAFNLWKHHIHIMVESEENNCVQTQIVIFTARQAFANRYIQSFDRKIISTYFFP